jgi:cyclophilin family peptidyl-prolyl cis-trans isomerase/HEAT repeat protein
MKTANLRKTLCAGLFVIAPISTAVGQRTSRVNSSGQIPGQVMLRIVRAEDERRWNDGLTSLLSDRESRVRRRAALALGRIGDERALPALSETLQSDKDIDVRQMCAFAIGEIESPAGAEALIAVADNTGEPGEVRARAVEALGKIGAVLLSNTAPSGNQPTTPKVEDKNLTKIRLAILDALKFESGRRRAMPDRQTILLGLTAALRVRPDGAGPVIVKFLGYSDPRIVADALNTMARLRLKDANDQVRKLLNNGDPIVRANAARVIGAAEDKGAFDALLDRALHDDDLRVRVSAIRALGSLKDARAGAPLLARGEQLYGIYRAHRSGHVIRPVEVNEILEIVNSLGRISAGTNNQRVVDWLRKLGRAAPEVNIAFARVAPQAYVEDTTVCCPKPPSFPLDVAYGGFSVAQGWAEVGAGQQGLSVPSQILRQSLCVPGVDGPECVRYRAKEIERSDAMRAYAAFKPTDLSEALRKQLADADVIARATAAELLGEQAPDEANTRALVAALPLALNDKDLNDAALSILDALAKQKSTAANDAIKTALDSSDHLIRRRAVALLKANGVGDFSSRIGTVKTRYTGADYRRAIARSGRKVTATVVTSKGAFMIEFLPDDAPLTVDNFVQLARKGYFNGQTIPRVVPNFVVQAGDPRGDQNGGPGYQIRCEINEAPYERGAVGMALSGKDTGGSQWFVTHSPQPHLDGGYTVFGRVIRGMEVVDSIARGDVIRKVIVSER